VITYSAKADADTIFNMTNHSYFNLDGQESASVLEQELWMDVDFYTPTDEKLIPTGEICPVDGTPMDFRKWKAIGSGVEADYPAIQIAGGYDHNFIFREGAGKEAVVKMRSGKSGIEMEVYTDQPAIQFYSGCQLHDEDGGKGGRVYPRFSACCLETQHFPDAPHHANFPETLVKAGEEYKTQTIYKFNVLE